jgi:hypothetical protein
MVRGYAHDGQEMNGQRATGWHYMVANGPKSRYGVHEVMHQAVGERGEGMMLWSY